MHRSTLHSIFGDFFYLSAVKQASDLLNRIVKTLRPLILAEDTTEGAAIRRLQIRSFESSTILGRIKAMFWVAIAIALALFLGQLK